LAHHPRTHARLSYAGKDETAGEAHAYHTDLRIVVVVADPGAKSTHPVSDRAAFATGKENEFTADANLQGIQDVGAFGGVSVEQGEIDVEFRIYEVSGKGDAFGAHAGQLVDENHRWSRSGMIDTVAEVLMGEIENSEAVKGLQNRSFMRHQSIQREWGCETHLSLQGDDSKTFSS
jgi:hypothetical protein